MSSLTAPARPRLGPRRIYLRALALMLVFLAGFFGLCSGVEVSERELHTLGYWAKAYYALGLFVVGGVDLGTPSGGPLLGRALLWGAYFLAPVITASAVVETLLRILNPFALRIRRLDDHVVIGGAGRLTALYVAKLRAQDRQVPIVVIERNPAKARIVELQEAHRALVVIGDVASNQILDGVGVGRARRVMLLTGDDFSNLDAASRVLARAPWMRGKVVAHVADLGFLRALPEASLDRGYETFNSLEFAAVHLVQARLLAHFESTPHLDLVIIAGFGRFGQTVLDQLQRHAGDQIHKVVIIDLEATTNAMRFAESPGFVEGYARQVIDGHLHHPAVWREVDGIVAADEGDPVIVIGTGDEGTNLHAGLDLIRRYPGAEVIVRSFGQSPFADQVAAESGLQPFRLADLVAESMPETWMA